MILTLFVAIVAVDIFVISYDVTRAFSRLVTADKGGTSVISRPQ